MNEELEESLKLLQTELQKENISTDIELKEHFTHEQLRDWLSAKIADLMQHDFHRLLAILYRIDVHENNVKRVFDEYTPHEIPSMIAELMIQRQLQKARTRIAYRKKNGGEWKAE
ncbi:MAG TPA: hypothetical protein VK202_09255 [Bacteroidia bacterium]|nr:hypothetical protein [Bacteroidia bacterium]